MPPSQGRFGQPPPELVAQSLDLSLPLTASLLKASPPNLIVPTCSRNNEDQLLWHQTDSLLRAGSSPRLHHSQLLPGPPFLPRQTDQESKTSTTSKHAPLHNSRTKRFVRGEVTGKHYYHHKCLCASCWHLLRLEVSKFDRSSGLRVWDRSRCQNLIPRGIPTRSNLIVLSFMSSTLQSNDRA